MKYIIPIFIVLVLTMVGFLIYNQGEVEESALITKEEIVELLLKNETGVDFLQQYDDFVIDEILLLTKEEIERRAAEDDYKEIYEPLNLEDNRYIMMKIINREGRRGLVGTVDLEEEEIVIIYYVFSVTVTPSINTEQ